MDKLIYFIATCLLIMACSLAIAIKIDSTVIDCWQSDYQPSTPNVHVDNLTPAPATYCLITYNK